MHTLVIDIMGNQELKTTTKYVLKNCTKRPQVGVKLCSQFDEYHRIECKMIVNNLIILNNSHPLECHQSTVIKLEKLS